jgi:hypothetical protein
MKAYGRGMELNSCKHGQGICIQIQCLFWCPTTTTELPLLGRTARAGNLCATFGRYAPHCAPIQNENTERRFATETAQGA